LLAPVRSVLGDNLKMMQEIRDRGHDDWRASDRLWDCIEATRSILSQMDEKTK
jgi:hypothetical protein